MLTIELWRSSKKYAPIVQLKEPLNTNQKVAGLSPAGSTIMRLWQRGFMHQTFNLRLRGFEPHQAHLHMHRWQSDLCNRLLICVGNHDIGLNPIRCTKYHYSSEEEREAHIFEVDVS